MQYAATDTQVLPRRKFLVRVAFLCGLSAHDRVTHLAPRIVGLSWKVTPARHSTSRSRGARPREVLGCSQGVPGSAIVAALPPRGGAAEAHATGRYCSYVSVHGMLATAAVIGKKSAFSSTEVSVRPFLAVSQRRVTYRFRRSDLRRTPIIIKDQRYEERQSITHHIRTWYIFFMTRVLIES